MAEKLFSMADVQRLIDTANNANPLIALPARQQLKALAEDQSRFADEEAWVWARHFSRNWLE
jgi:hypothetical protein